MSRLRTGVQLLAHAQPGAARCSPGAVVRGAALCRLAEGFCGGDTDCNGLEIGGVVGAATIHAELGDADDVVDLGSDAEAVVVPELKCVICDHPRSVSAQRLARTRNTAYLPSCGAGSTGSTTPGAQRRARSSSSACLGLRGRARTANIPQTAAISRAGPL